AAVQAESSGLDFQMWGTIVDRDGVVCAVAFSGDDRGSQWPGSRVIAAQKANTANAFGLDGLALSTANLYSAVQPGGSLYGLQHSNPVDTDVAYGGSTSAYGTAHDPMVGRRIGGVDVFGGPAQLFANDPTHPDNIIYDIGTNNASGFGHPTCLNTGDQLALPPVS